MKKIIKNIIRYGLVILLCYFGYKQLEKNKATIQANAQLSQQRNDVIPVITEEVGPFFIEDNYEAVGTFAPYKQVPLMSQVAGKATSVNFENGSFVKEGNTLVITDNEMLYIKIETTKLNIKKAEKDLQRLNNLLGDGGVTQQQIDNAKLAVDNLKGEARVLRKQIAMTKVKAPISGTISHKKVEKGLMISPSMQLAQITNVSKLKMQVYLTEDQVVNIQTGQSIDIIADIFPDQTISGKIKFIDVNAGQGKRYLVEVEIPNEDQQLKAGMTGTAFFGDGYSREILAIPRASVVGSIQNAKVYVVENGIAKLRNFEAGQVIQNKVHVKSGLELGETIVVSGQINLEDGMKISQNEN